MKPQREQVFVGLFVLIAVGVLIAAVFAINGAFGRSAKTYHSRFKFAGGLEAGATVRYSGGPKIGRVENVRVDSQDPSLIDLTFSVQPDFPVKTDSKTRIMSLSPLGDNHLELLPGSIQAPEAPSGALIPSESYVDFNAVLDQVNEMSPTAQHLMHTLDDRATELKETLNRVNDLLSAQNRANLSATLAQTRGMITENRPQLRATLQNMNTLTKKLDPLLDNFKQTSEEANKVLTHVDDMVGETRPEVRQAIADLRTTLNGLNELTGRLDQLLDVNSVNIDQLLDNLINVTENLKEFTDELKTRPNSLIFAPKQPEHVPGGKQ